MLLPAEGRTIRRRTRRDPKPRFKPDRTHQLDAITGCPALQVPENHLARAVLRFVDQLDLSTIEAKYSSLGRRGYSPRNLLAVWIYASLVGVHHATKVEQRLKTDVAFRLLSGGYAISRPPLNRFRLENAALFAQAIEKSVAMAREAGLISLDDVAVDSMRLRAHASQRETRTMARSVARLKQLGSVDATTLDASAREAHEAKLARHRRVVEQCQEQARASVVATNPLAALMKFPDGAAAPAHRVTAIAAGARARFIVAVLVTADANDFGQLAPAIDATLDVRRRLGVESDAPLRVTADAGYASQLSLELAERLHHRGIDVLVDAKHPPGVNTRRRFFGHDRFTVEGRSAVCPAGTPMRGPKKKDGDRLEWTGVGCETCTLRSQCTDGKARTLTVQPELERLRAAMVARLDSDEGKQRYRRRLATVEPVFSNLESTMGYRRASSRNETTVVAEVLLKVLAHNVSRLVATKRLRVVYFFLTSEGTLVPCESGF